jgi:prepilin-type N-terminal cleavage/methylation domain-containing protein/prepilin-type processing-associated H-X9-DG protein
MKTGSVNQRAFTLIELLVVIAIIALLAGLGHAAFSNAMGKAQTAGEVSAAKNLIAAYHAAAADGGGKYLYAYDPKAKGLKGADGKPIMDLAAKDYAFRLAPYFNHAIDDTLLVSGNKRQIQEKMNFSPGMPMFDYIVSRFPSFGINRQFVGGVAGESDPECVRTTAHAANSIVVFASSGTSEISGYGYVGAPTGRWKWQGSDWSADADPGSFGYVDARHGGKAVVAFLDGSTRLMTIKELRDMRLWSMRAAQADDPNYTPKN